MKITIPVFTVLSDNGDGGYTMRAYNSKEEWVNGRVANHNRGFEKGWEKEEITPEKFIELADDDEYSYGYQGEDSISIEEVDGKWRLAEELSFHAGQ